MGIVGCRETLPPAAQPVYQALTESDVKATARRLVILRGLPLREDPKVVLHDQAGFERAIDATHSRKPAEPNQLAALFGLVRPSAERKPLKPDNEAAKQNVGGFYAHRDKSVHMPNLVPKTGEQAEQQRIVLAHELHHAMQYQSFTAPDFASDDAAMAWKALIEGDAQVAGLLIQADRDKISESRMLRRARYAVAKPTPVSPLSSPVGRTGWEALPMADESLREFPYREGMAFAIDLYRAGGFETLNRAYTRPPESTEHIMHPEKYLAGERSRPIDPLPPPPGWKIGYSSSLGELETRIVLEPCLGRKVASQIAAGWNGDHAFAIEGETEMMLGWVTAWDTEADAIELEDGLARMGPCLGVNDFGGKAIAAAFSIRRTGSVVAFARGGSQSDRAAVLERLISLPKDAGPATPIGTAKVPPLVAPPEPTGGAIEGDVYRSEFFGLAGAAAPFDADVWTPSGTKLRLPKVTARKVRAGGSMGYSIKLANPARIEDLFADWEERVIRIFAKDGYETTRYEDLKEVRTGLGPGYERSWTQRRGVLVYRVTVVPICGGTGSISFSTAFSTKPGRELMDYWIQSFRWIQPKQGGAPDGALRPPVCEYLDPESQTK